MSKWVHRIEMPGFKPWRRLVRSSCCIMLLCGLCMYKISIVPGVLVDAFPSICSMFNVQYVQSYDRTRRKESEISLSLARTVDFGLCMSSYTTLPLCVWLQEKVITKQSKASLMSEWKAKTLEAPWVYNVTGFNLIWTMLCRLQMSWIPFLPLRPHSKYTCQFNKQGCVTERTCSM